MLCAIFNYLGIHQDNDVHRFRAKAQAREQTEAKQNENEKLFMLLVGLDGAQQKT